MKIVFLCLPFCLQDKAKDAPQVQAVGEGEVWRVDERGITASQTGEDSGG